MRDYVLTLFIFGILPFCLYRPWLGIIAWYWLGLMNPHRMTWGFAYTMPFAMLIGGATLLGAIPSKDRRPIPWNRELIIVVVLMLYFILTTLTAWAPIEAWAEWQKVFKVVLMTYVATMFIYGKDRIRILMFTIIGSISFYAVKSLIYVIRTGGGGRIDGIPGSFLDGNTFMGLAFCMVVPLAFVAARVESRPRIRRTLNFLAVSTLIAVIFTYSRGAYLGVAAIVPLLFLRAKSKPLAMCLLIPTLLILPFVLPDRANERIDLLENYEQESSANQRLQAWTVAWNVAKANPLTGAGFEFEYADDARWMQYASEKYYWALQRASAAHSIYFQVLGQHGFVAFGLYMTVLIGTLLALQRTKRIAERNDETKWIGVYASGLQIGMAGYMVSGAFLNSAYFDLAWLYIAFSAILRRELGPVVARTKASRYSLNPMPSAIPSAGIQSMASQNEVAG